MKKIQLVKQHLVNMSWKSSKPAMALVMIAVVGIAFVALLAYQAIFSSPQRVGNGTLGSLADKLYWSRAVINGTVGPSTVEVAPGSSFSVVVSFTYLEGRLADHVPINLLLDAHQSQLVVAVTYNDTGTIKQIALNDLITWNESTLFLSPAGSATAIMTVNIPSEFPLRTVYFPPLFGFSPTRQVTTNVPSIEMTVH